MIAGGGLAMPTFLCGVTIGTKSFLPTAMPTLLCGVTIATKSYLPAAIGGVSFLLAVLYSVNGMPPPP